MIFSFVAMHKFWLGAFFTPFIHVTERKRFVTRFDYALASNKQLVVCSIFATTTIDKVPCTQIIYLLVQLFFYFRYSFLFTISFLLCVCIFCHCVLFAEGLHMIHLWAVIGCGQPLCSGIQFSWHFHCCRLFWVESEAVLSSSRTPWCWYGCAG